MKNYSDQTYTYAGKKYTFIAQLYVNTPNDEKDGNYLVNESILLFQYENALNQLYLKGELVYVDRLGVVDRFLEQQLVYLQVQHIMHETNVDGDITIEKLSETDKFQHTFLVDSIQIVERKCTEITYRLKLASQNWLNCMSYVQYSNYNKEPEDIFDIVKGIIGQKGLIAHKDTFDAIKSDVKISYITNENDNVLTSVKHLLRKLYYYTEKMHSMKFIVYNETAHRYQLFDVANQNYVNGTSMLIVSMFKSQSETQLQHYPTQLATITKFPKQKTFRSMFRRELYDYDYAHNSFVDCSIPSSSIVDFKNEKPMTTEEHYEKKFNDLKSDLEYKRSDTYWNNDLDIYGEVAKLLNEDNSLVATADAELLRKPGAYVTVNVDRDDIKVAGEEDIRKLQDIKNKYKAIEGLWFVGKVRHLISPSQAKYQQNLVLFRNFVKKYN